MINQNTIGLNSRAEVDPFINNMLPLITAPMSSVVDDSNYNAFEFLGITPIIPRTSELPIDYNGWIAMSLTEFTDRFAVLQEKTVEELKGFKICIDVANGNMPHLHKAITTTKKHNPDIVIMAGNVGSVEAFSELAKTGVDYIRVGIGGGGGCHTSRNTGVGQECLETLVQKCVQIRNHAANYFKNKDLLKTYNEDSLDRIRSAVYDNQASKNLVKVQIVADGISTYIQQCKEKYGFNDNGYAAIIKLLYSGADLVMVGKLFAQAKESAGEKNEEDHWEGHKVLYSGMSTQKEQKSYSNAVKPSEGSSTWLDVRWSLREWLYGREDQDVYPYLNGFVNSLRSAMAYRGAKNLKEFKQ